MNAPTILIPRTHLLYHFTAARFVEPIKVEGLRKGALPWHRCRITGEPLVIRNWHEQTMTAAQIEGMRSIEHTFEAKARKGVAGALEEQRRFFPGFQWLTKNPSFDQPFALLGDLPFAKNASRITVLIPQAAETALHRWQELCERHKPQAAEELNTNAVDWQNWSVFNGWIPQAWFLEVHRNPGQTTAAAFVEP